MHCQTCDTELTPEWSSCSRCGTPTGSPVVWPTVRTYSVLGLAVAAVVAVVMTVLVYTLYSLWPLVGRQMAMGALDRRNPNLLNQAALLEGLLTLAYLPLVLGTAVLIIIWAYRARKNLDAFPGADTTLSPGWAIAGWLVPFANFVVPARIMANLLRSSLWRSPLALVGIWWTSWLVVNVADRVVRSQDDAAYAALPHALVFAGDYQRYVDYYQEALGRNLVPLAFMVLAGITVCILLVSISRAQEARIDRGVPQLPISMAPTAA